MKKLILLLFLIPLLGFGQMKTDTLKFKGTNGQIYQLRSSGDTIFLNSDSLLSISRILREIHDSIFRPEKTYIISPSGGDYTTILLALDAHPVDSALFIVYPAIYVDETINFTADNQCIVGAGLTPQHIITNTAQIIDFGAFTGCMLSNIKLVGTYTSAIDMITGNGSLIARDVHLEVAASGAIAGSPTVINTTGSFTQVRGTLKYNNEAISGGQIKRAINIGAGSSFEFRRVTIDVDGSGAAAAITTGYGAGTGVLNTYRCIIDVSDTTATIVNGLAYLGGSGENEFYGNDIHVTCGAATGKVAYGFLLTSATSLTTRGMFNHLHVIDGVGGSKSYGFNIGANCTVVSQFDDIIADDGNLVTGTLTQVNSLEDGSLNLSNNLFWDNGADIQNDDAQILEITEDTTKISGDLWVTETGLFGNGVQLNSWGKVASSGKILNGSDTLVDANAVYDFSQPIYEAELTEGQNNIDVGFSLSSTTLVFFNGNSIPTSIWSGTGTQIINLAITTKLYDRLKVKK